MKLTIERAALLSALGHAQSVVERRNTIPILSNVLVSAANGQLSLTATDLDMDVVENAAADIGQDGTTTVPAHTFYDIVRKLPEGSQVELAFDSERSRMTMRAGRSQFSLSCLPKEDFPALSEGDLPHRFVMAAAEVKRLIDKTRFAISTEETRYYLNGIYLHAAEEGGRKTLRAVATDGHRLALADMPLPSGAEGMPGIIVPRKAINELRKLVDDVDGEVSIGLSDTKIRFSFDDLVLTSKLIDGTFPDYERVIPSGNDKVLEVDTHVFAEAVDRVSTISTEKSRAIKLTLEKDSLVLSATSPDAGSATEEIPVSYDAESLEVGFNSKYLLDITALIEGDNAQALMADAASPTMIKDSADDDVLFVVMPMRV
jgi:DNA polymerase-3 subunit beta